MSANSTASITPHSGARWVTLPADSAAEVTLASELGISRLVARLLVNRGYNTPESAQAFMNPSLSDFHDPKLLPDFEAATREILLARDQKKLIYIHGDYDVDGITSAALLSRFLRRIGCEVYTHVPHRLKEGYGINVSAVAHAHEMGAHLFLTCDCGSGAIEQIDRAKELGMRVVVTDHHELHMTQPNADAFVNPHRKDSVYPFDHLCGVGVAFKLCAGIAEECGIPTENFYRAFLDLAALGTVADVMPLVGENRVIVAHGCPRIQESQKPGMRALLERIDGKYGVTPRTIGFQLAPRLNAAGRIDDASLSLDLLLSDDLESARQIAGKLEDINTARRAEQDRIIEGAKLRVLEEGLHERNAIVIGAEGWHSGIIGLVAGRLVETFYRPAFVMTFGADGVAKGSARTVPGYHLADALKRTTQHLKTHGGHELAAGFSANFSNVEAFQAAIEADALAMIPPEMLIPTRTIDAETSVTECNMQALHDLEKLAPFGQSNPEPTFVAHRLRVEKIGPTSEGKPHAKLTVRDESGASVVVKAWRMLEDFSEVAPGDEISLVFNAEINAWNGRESVEWVVKDFAKTS